MAKVGVIAAAHSHNISEFREELNKHYDKNITDSHPLKHLYTI